MNREADGGSTLGLAVAIASVTAVGLGVSLAIPLLSLTLQARGVDPGWIGINAAASGLASMVATPFVPAVARRTGTGMLLAVAILAVAATLPLFYLVGDFWLWFPLRFISGAAIAATFVLSEFWIAAAAPPGRRGLVMGIYATVLSIGFALGPAILSLTGTESILPFLVGAGAIALAVVPVIVAPVKSPIVGRLVRGAFLRFLIVAPAATLAAFVFGIAESGSFAILPVYGSHAGHPADTVVLFGAAMTLGNVALQIPIGLASDRFDRRRLLFICASAGLAGVALMPLLVGSLWPALLLLFVWGGFIGGLYTVGLAHLAGRFTGGDLAAANSAFLFCYAAGTLLGPAALGLGIEAIDPHGFALFLGVPFVAYVGLVLLRMRQSRR
ncbi:MAG TPA: MFS transporter [Bauldia sp.]|nr:MFS transporter [Bauldia sp.]